jgi:hypothetical protein
VYRESIASRDPRLPRATAVRIAAALLCLSVLGACGPESGGHTGLNSATPSGPRLAALPVSQYADGKMICAAAGHPGPIWLRAVNGEIVGQDGKSTFPLRWPPGYHAVFDPSFTEVLTESGAVFAAAGADINTDSGVVHNDIVCYGGVINIWQQPSPVPT